MKSKKLEEMSLEELWELFPIVLAEHNPEWKKWASDEISYLSGVLLSYSPRISHIGSTAIPGILAKPIVDILVETRNTDCWKDIKALMIDKGYICMSESENRMSFNKGYTVSSYAERVFHIHFNIFNDNKEISFRNYLIEHPDTAREYERLKLRLLEKFCNDRDAYTEAKTGFINEVLSKCGERHSGFLLNT